MKATRPEGYNSASPFMMVGSIAKELAFLKAVFDAEEKEQQLNAAGEIWHSEVRIGDSIIMLERAQAGYPADKSMVYVWVEDVDATYARGLREGAISVEEPKNQIYGNREAGLKDAQGNIWWLGQEVEKLSGEEIERRLEEQRKSKM